MPCDDTKAIIKICIDKFDCLKKYTYHKITCDKPITMNDRVFKDVMGNNLFYFLDLKIPRLINQYRIKNKEEEFLTSKVLSTIKNVAALYLGQSKEKETNKAEIVHIDYDLERTIISAVIHPPENLPPIIPCSSRN